MGACAAHWAKNLGPGDGKTLLPVTFTACAALGRPRFPSDSFSRFSQRRLSSNAFCRRCGGHVKYETERSPDLSPITQRWPVLVSGAQYPRECFFFKRGCVSSGYCVSFLRHDLDLLLFKLSCTFSKIVCTFRAILPKNSGDVTCRKLL